MWKYEIEKIHPIDMDEMFQVHEKVDAPAVGGDATENIPYIQRTRRRTDTKILVYCSVAFEEHICLK